MLILLDGLMVHFQFHFHSFLILKYQSISITETSYNHALEKQMLFAIISKIYKYIIMIY